MPKTTSTSSSLVRTLFLIAIAGIVSTITTTTTHGIRADEKGPDKTKGDPADKTKKAEGPAGEFGKPKVPVGEFGAPVKKVDPAAAARAKAREEFEKLKSLNKPLLKVGAEDTFKLYRTDFQKALSDGTPGAPLSKPKKGIFTPTLKTDLDVITDGLKYRVYRFADIAERKNLATLSKDLLGRDLRFVGKNQAVNPQAFVAFRELVFKLIVDNCRDLMSNNLYVRLHALYLVAQLDVIAPNEAKDVQAFTYAGSNAFLLEIVTDPQHHLALRIAALKGIQRILYSNKDFSQLPDAPEVKPTELTDDERHDIVASLVALLAQPGQHIWFQRQLVQALGMSQVVRTAGTPQVDVAAVLLGVLKDRETRHWRISAEASHAISRLPLTAANNIDNLVYETLKLETLMIGAFNKQTKKEFYWKRCFGLMYLTYKPPTPAQRRRMEGLYIKADAGGPLAAKKAKIMEAGYPVMRDVLKDMLKVPPAFAQTTMELLNSALKATKPAQAAAQPRAVRPNPATPPRANPAAARLPASNVATASTRDRS